LWLWWSWDPFLPPRITAALGNLALPRHDKVKHTKVK
jgi:hypothetical protein